MALYRDFVVSVLVFWLSYFFCFHFHLQAVALLSSTLFCYSVCTHVFNLAAVLLWSTFCFVILDWQVKLCRNVRGLCWNFARSIR